MQSIYGLIGFPLEHSFSKEYFSQKFKNEGIDQTCRYELFPLPQIGDLPDLLALQTALKGLNVTIPHKTAVLKYVHECDLSVKEIGAANVLKIGKHKHITAYNTDCIGFEKSFMPMCRANHTKALIFGSGGAALAVAYVLEKHGMDYLFVSRSSGTARSISYQQAGAYMKSGYHILINTTPLGMYPTIDISVPIDYEIINSSFLCFDLVYNPRLTKFLRICQSRGALIKDGYEMLCLQADAAWEIWNTK